MCQINTFMFKDGEIDCEKLIGISKIFQSQGYDCFCEYSNPSLRNIRRDLRIFQLGNACDCGSILTKKVVVDEKQEKEECDKLINIISNSLNFVDTVYLFSHWYKKNLISKEKVVLDRVPKKVSLQDLNEDAFRDIFYDEVLEITK